MKTLSFHIGFALFLVLLLSCSRDSVYKLSSVSDNRVLVAEERGTMESVIDCGVARACEGLSVMELLYQKKAYSVQPGTRVAAGNGFAFSSARHVRILEGEHAGKEGWVYEGTLVADRSEAPVYQAKAR